MLPFRVRSACVPRAYACAGVLQVATEPQEFHLPRSSGFFVTFAASAASLALALFAFFSASGR